MPQLISYAQNHEDVVLYRALGHLETGFYIDVGAFDPSYDSVTKLFYERGWSGINVEPSARMYERLKRERRRDQNINVAVSDINGQSVFYQIGQTGLSTLDVKVLDKARVDGLPIEEMRVEVRTLAEVCRDCSNRDVHFLKIDVEGAERKVLLGADLTNVRPWIIVVEATIPGTSERVDDQWRFLLEDAGYEPVLFDGLNLFFLSREHPELRCSLLAPANVVDSFIPVQHHAALLRLGTVLAAGEDGEGSLAEGSPERLRELIAWHSAVAQESLERESAERIAWHRADAEASVLASMEKTIAWNRADAEAVVRQSIENSIAWHRADAEAVVRRSMNDLISWHRADASERAFQRGLEIKDLLQQDALFRETEAKKVAVEQAAALRRLRLEQASQHHAIEADLNAVRSQYEIDAAEIKRAHRVLALRYAAILDSTSWRLTRPLRVLMRFLRRLKTWAG